VTETTTELAKARERLAIAQARIRRADDMGRRHTVKMTGDYWAARRAVETLEQEQEEETH
jgi:hypothetical protein